MNEKNADCRGVTRALIGWGGGCIFIYSCSALFLKFLLKSVVLNFISKEISEAEHEYVNIDPQLTL